MGLGMLSFRRHSNLYVYLNAIYPPIISSQDPDVPASHTSEHKFCSAHKNDATHKDAFDNLRCTPVCMFFHCAHYCAASLTRWTNLYHHST